MSHKISNTYNEAMGTVKEKLGHATHNPHMAGDGAAQKADAQLNQPHQKGQTYAQGAGHNIQGQTYGQGVGPNTQGQTYGQGVGPNVQGHAPVQGVAHNIEGQTQKAAGTVMNDPNLRARGNANDALGDVQRNY
ncbi:hypothetical protein BGZ96_012725 [Linnemannia gamsii]|uniref:CsbD-like domain-containing protein n=1 Tax=Linnemannia gamsii TaxID=64522 RepID=A0ABQ7JPX9_9FUNG|nr:hypothetical protein BGZ96_012725 [Linnemannia gamsii]